jgi:hypothetical protein
MKKWRLIRNLNWRAYMFESVGDPELRFFFVSLLQVSRSLVNLRPGNFKCIPFS